MGHAAERLQEVLVLSNAHIGYGLGLTALFEAVLTVAVPRWRHPALIVTTTIVTVLAVLGWQYVLRATHAAQFFTDLPFRPFPISWQNTESVFEILVR
jgi:uncharacterized membrane protein YqjE